MKTIKIIGISTVLSVSLLSTVVFAADEEEQFDSGIPDKKTESFLNKAKGGDNKEIIHIDSDIDSSISKKKEDSKKAAEDQKNQKGQEKKEEEVKVNSPLYWNLGIGLDLDFLGVEGHKPAQPKFFTKAFLSKPGFSLSLGAGNIVFSFKEWVLTVETVLTFNHTEVEKNPSPFTDDAVIDGGVGANKVRDLFERSPFTADALVGFLSPPIIADRYSIKGFFGTSITQFSYSVASIDDAGGSPMSNGDVFGSGVGIGFKVGGGLLMPFKDFFSGGEMFAGLGTCDVTYFPSTQVSISTTYRRLKSNFAIHCGASVQFGGTVVSTK